MSRISKRWRLIAVLLLLLSFWFMVGSAVQKSPTVDEQSKLFRGAAYLTENATQFLLGHPLLGSSVAALGTLLEPNLNVGVDQPFWESGNWSIAGDAFMWQLNQNPQRLIFLGRLPIIFAALLLGALLFRWASQLRNRLTGLLAMALLLLDPNFIAHARLVTGDLLLTAFFALTLYGFWLIYQSEDTPAWGYLITGLGLGLASMTKYSAAILLPILGILTLYFCFRQRSWKPIRHFAFIFGIGGLLIVAFYRFELRPLPGGAFWDDLFWVLDYFADDHGAYLFGQTSPNGWWYYFPVTFVLKTPVPTLLLLLLAGIFYLRFTLYDLRAKRYKSTFKNPQSPIPNPQSPILPFLLIPPVIYLLFAMSGSLNIGYRHMLPMLPFLFVFTAVSLTTSLPKPIQRGVPVLLLWLSVLSVWIFPNYIPFFNLAAGGSQNGWRLLSDSNVDWGQDLPALAQWQEDSGTESLFLSYFGTAHPSAYGVEFSHIPTWAPTPEQTLPERQRYNPSNPAPGIYAISINHLHGVVLDQNRDFYELFRSLEPIARIGNSIFVYEILPNGPSEDVVYSGLRPSTLDPLIQFESNAVHIRWVDTNTALLWPNEGGWLLVEGKPMMVEQFLGDTAVLSENNQFKYQLSTPPQLDWMQTEQPVEDTITFLGTELIDINSNIIKVNTAWRSEKPITQPIQIFIHALNDQDEIVGQWDGIHSDITSWSTGDVFVQFHSFVISEETEFQRLATGFYNPANGTRLGEPIIIFDKE